MSNAEYIAAVLGRARPSGRGWLACCPAHDDRHPSLSLEDGEDGKVLWHCHAGCSQDAVRDRLLDLDLLPRRPKTELFPKSRRKPKSKKPSQCKPNGGAAPAYDDAELDKIRYAERIWRQAHRLRGTLGEEYLRSRGYDGPLPKSLRYHPELRHGPTGRLYPAIVAYVKVWPFHDLRAVQRIYLARDGSGKAPVQPAKMSLGPVQSGAVRFGKVHDAMVIGEGIETTLAAKQFSGLPGWAALGSWNMYRVFLPFGIKEVVIAADHDKAGKIGAEKLWAKLQKQGVHATIAYPPEKGADWADVAVLNNRRRR